MNDIQVAKEKHKEILELYKRLSQEVSNTISSYYIWRTLYFSRSTRFVGKKKAEQNAKLLNLYGHFFQWTEYSHLHYFIIGINKFFDPKNLGFESIITKITRYKKFLTPELIKEIYPNRFDRNDIIYKRYIPITVRDISEIEGWKKRYENILGRLKSIRDGQSAHIGFKRVDNIAFNPGEINKLIIAIQKIYNKLTRRFDRTTTDWRSIREGAIKDTKFLIDSLQRAETQRLKEIKERWG